jgi:hypothetical protein
LILCGQIYRPGLGRHDPTKARRVLGSGYATVSTLQAGTTRPKLFLGFTDPNPFDTKHDEFDQADPAQFPPLHIHIAGSRGWICHPSHTGMA